MIVYSVWTRADYDSELMEIFDNYNAAKRVFGKISRSRGRVRGLFFRQRMRMCRDMNKARAGVCRSVFVPGRRFVILHKLDKSGAENFVQNDEKKICFFS